MNAARTAVLASTTAAAGAVAATLVVARTVAPATRRGIELVALTPAGLPAALVAAVAALVLMRRYRGVGGAALVIAFVLVAIHAWWLAPRFVGTVPAAAGPRLVVMVQNAEDTDTVALVSLAQEQDVDVLVLTDTTDEQVADLTISPLGRQLPHDTLADGRGSVVWSRFPIIADALVSEHGDSRVVALAVPGIGGVDLVAVHPTPPYVSDGERWRADWEDVLAKVRDTVGAGTGPVVVVGDLNATPDHWPLRSLGELGFRDAAEQLNTGMAATWPANGRLTRAGLAVPSLLPLDHVLTAGGLVAVHQVISGVAGGDHMGVVATLAPAAE